MIKPSGCGIWRRCLQSDNSRKLRPPLSLFPTADGEWIAWTPDGYFAASEKGARQIGYSVNQGLDRTATFVSVDQLYDRFYRPDLVHARLHGDPQKLWQQKEASTDVKEVIAGGLAPRVAFINPTADTAVDRQVVDVHANVMDQGGGIGKVVWRINETTVATDSYADSSTSRLATASQTSLKTDLITLKQQFTLLPGNNTVELVAYNQRNEIASSPAVLTLTVTPPPAAPQITAQSSPATATLSLVTAPPAFPTNRSAARLATADRTDRFGHGPKPLSAPAATAPTLAQPAAIRQAAPSSKQPPQPSLSKPAGTSVKDADLMQPTLALDGRGYQPLSRQGLAAEICRPGRPGHR